MGYLPTYNEEEVLLRLAQGDKQAFEIIYHQYYLSVFRFAKKFVHDIAAAEDITTECFLKVWDKRSDFDHSRKLKSFVFISTRNACLNYLRGEKRLVQNRDALEFALGNAAETEFQQHLITEMVFRHLYEEIEKLPTKMKTILKLQLEGLKNEEIAERMGIAEKTVRNLKVESMKLLKVALMRRDMTTVALAVYLFGNLIAMECRV